MMVDHKPFISGQAKINGELAKSRDEDGKQGKDTKAFWYWLGYFNGQNSIQETKQGKCSP